MGKFIDLTNQKYGKLTVLKRDSVAKNGHIKWLCVCECGNTKVVAGCNLKNGQTKSCGCESSRNSIGERSLKHGKRNSRLYSIWTNMKTRCYNPSYNEFYAYGGKGITMCDEWKNSFQLFYEWAVNNGYDDSLSIDRIDNSEGYSPSNCRWADKYIQARNKTNNVLIDYNGKRKCLAEWSEETGINEATLRYRLSNNWDIERIFEQKVQ